MTDEIDQVERARAAEAKIAALKRKVGQLTMELDILKKMRQAGAMDNEKVSIVSGPSTSPQQRDVGP